MLDESMRMWSYWRDKKGTVEALEDYFPKTLAANPVLQLALATIKINLSAIDTLMLEHEAEDIDEG